MLQSNSSISQLSGISLVGDIAGAKTFNELEQLRRRFLAAIGLQPEERRAVENALATRERDLIEFYRGRF